MGRFFPSVSVVLLFLFFMQEHFQCPNVQRLWISCMLLIPTWLSECLLWESTFLISIPLRDCHLWKNTFLVSIPLIEYACGDAHMIPSSLHQIFLRAFTTYLNRWVLETIEFHVLKAGIFCAERDTMTLSINFCLYLWPEVRSSESLKAADMDSHSCLCLTYQSKEGHRVSEWTGFVSMFLQRMHSALHKDTFW